MKGKIMSETLKTIVDDIEYFKNKAMSAMNFPTCVSVTEIPGSPMPAETQPCYGADWREVGRAEVDNCCKTAQSEDKCCGEVNARTYRVLIVQATDVQWKVLEPKLKTIVASSYGLDYLWMPVSQETLSRVEMMHL